MLNFFALRRLLSTDDLICVPRQKSLDSKPLEAYDNSPRRQIFAFDDDISFEEFYRLPFIARWNVIFVSALRRDSIERPRKMRRQELDRNLIRRD